MYCSNQSNIDTLQEAPSLAKRAKTDVAVQSSGSESSSDNGSDHEVCLHQTIYVYIVCSDLLISGGLVDSSR